MIPATQRLTGKVLAKSMQLTAGIIRAGYQGIDSRRHSIRHWVKKGETLKNIEVTDGNIKSFERTARKYGVKFALKKDTGKQPPQYLVFFRARDADVLTAAFREYTARQLMPEKNRKPSVKKHLELLRERAGGVHENPEKIAQKVISR